MNRTVDGPGYTGHIADGPTGLVYMQQRYYDPVVGRFISVDPMGVDTGTGWNFNRYSYANNNPYTYVDPDGRCGTRAQDKTVAYCASVALLPTTTALGERGESGTASSNIAGGVKQAINSAADIASLASGNPSNVFFPGYRFEIANDELAGASVVEGATAVGTPVAGLRGIFSSLLRRGAQMYRDLTRAEIKAINSVVAEAGRPLSVVGSAASGTRRGVGTSLPLGKGPGTRSDTDYVVPPSSLPYFQGISHRLPGIDPNTGIIPGHANPYMGPIIRFEP